MLAVIVPLMIIAIVSFIFVNTAVQISEEFITQIPTVVQEIEIVETRYEPTPTPNLYAQPLLEFGEEGTGPGQFDDARQITVGLDGSIYVADYNSGRVQKFDQQGKFLYQILVEPGRNETWIIHDLAVDTAGQLYVVRVGDILVYNGLDGKLMNTIDGKDLKAFFQAAAVDATNKLYALHATASEDDLVLFDQAGTLLQRNQDIITQVNPKDAAMDLRIAVDGTGNSYILSTFGNQVYIYDRFANFIDRFGSVGKSPGQFDNPNGIAVDGNKMIYVLNSQEVQQFDENGTYLRSLKIQPGNGAWRDLVLDTQANLYIVTGLGKVLKFEPIQP